MSLLAIHFDISELRFRKSTPYILAAFSTLWLATLFPPMFLLIPAILFLGFRAAVWSAMSYAEFENHGRRSSRERLIRMLPNRVKNKCPKAINLRNYIVIAPIFWTLYVAFILVMTAQALL